MLAKVVLALALFVLASGQDTRADVLPTAAEYRGQQVARINGIETPAEAAEVAHNVLEVFWQNFSEGKMTARLSPRQVAKLKELGFGVDVVVADLAMHLTEAMAETQPALQSRAFDDAANPDKRFTRYYSYKQIGEYLDKLANVSLSNGKRKWVTKKSIGHTGENRPIWAIEIGNPKASNVIYMQGGLHAREWVAPSSVQYIIAKWIDLLATGKQPKWFNDTMYAFVPLANPDGFQYSYDKERLWRKNRRNHTNTDCLGVDLNRNFNGFNGWAPMSNPCSDVYGGPAAYSEPETKAVVAYLKGLKNNHRIVAAFDIHSFDQSILYPYGYDFDLPDAPNKDTLIECAKKMVSAMKASSGKTYSVKNSAALYPASGCADDYLYDKVVRGPWANGTGIVYTVEMRPKSDDPIGFVLPASQLLSSVKELHAGFIAAVKYIMQKI